MSDLIKTYETKKLTIEVNRSTCISCGTCTLIAPKTFALDKKSICCVLPSSNDSGEMILEAVNSCATESIKVIIKK